MTAFWMVDNQFQKFIDSQITLDYDSQMTDKYFIEYTGIDVKHFKDTLLQHMSNVKRSALLKGHVIKDKSSGTESEVQDYSSRLRIDTDLMMQISNHNMTKSLLSDNRLLNIITLSTGKPTY
ncbi:hypothetical protein Tco_0667404 [Tanacetum coccineum]